MLLRGRRRRDGLRSRGITPACLSPVIRRKTETRSKVLKLKRGLVKGMIMSMHSRHFLLAAALVVSAALPSGSALADQIRYIGKGSGSGNITQANGMVTPFTNFDFEFHVIGDLSNVFVDAATQARLIPLFEPVVTFSGGFGSVQPTLAPLQAGAQRVMAVGLPGGPHDGQLAFSEYYPGGSVQLGHALSGPGLVGWDGLSSLPLVSNLTLDQAEFDIANGNTWYWNTLNALTFEAIVLGLTAENPLMPVFDDPTSGFVFDITAEDNVRYYFDPFVAAGYDFSVADGNPLITEAIFPTIGSSLYSIYALNNLVNPLFTGIAGGTAVDFTGLFPGGIQGFALRGIDVSAGLDPNDPTAFVTGLTFAGGGQVTLTQAPVSVFVAEVPEPSTWTMLIAGFGLVGAGLRRRPAVARPAAA